MNRAILMLALAVPVLADSVTRTDNLTGFGHVEQMSRTEVTLRARFPAGKGVETKDVVVPREKILKIEFNTTTFNPGGPPAIGLRPGEASKSVPPESDVVVLRGGQREKCPGVLIEGDKVLCGKKELDRGSVIRILLGGK